MKTLCKMLIILCAVTLASCGHDRTAQQTQSHSFGNDTVYIEKDDPLFANLSIVTANEAPFSKQIEAPAKISADPTQLAYINLPFAGKAVKSYVRLGQKVNAGTALFEIVSADFIAAQKDFFQAQSERDLALKDLQRKEELHKKGVASQRELEEAANTFKVADKEYDNAVAAIKIFHPDPQNMTVGQPLIICSPIAGDVIENNVVIGQYFKDDENYAVAVANLQKVWIKAHISEKDIRFVHQEDLITVRVDAQPDKQLSGKIFHISDMIDEETRTISVLAECDNREKLLKVGMFATVVITATPQNKIVVPENAVMQDEKNSYVFVKTNETSFVKRKVDIEITSDGKAILSSGLENGTEIIGNGGFYLK